MSQSNGLPNVSQSPSPSHLKLETQHGTTSRSRDRSAGLPRRHRGGSSRRWADRLRGPDSPHRWTSRRPRRRSNNLRRPTRHHPGGLCHGLDRQPTGRPPYGLGWPRRRDHGPRLSNRADRLIPNSAATLSVGSIAISKVRSATVSNAADRQAIDSGRRIVVASVSARIGSQR